MGMVQHGACYTLGRFPMKGRHQQGLAAAWPEEKPGLGICRQIIISLCYWSYYCWHLQPGLCTGTDKLGPWIALFEETSCSIRYSLCLIIFNIPWEKVDLTLKRVGEKENLSRETIQHFYCFPFVRKCFKHRSQSWGTTEVAHPQLLDWFSYWYLGSDCYCMGQSTSQ